MGDVERGLKGETAICVFCWGGWCCHVPHPEGRCQEGRAGRAGWTRVRGWHSLMCLVAGSASAVSSQCCFVFLPASQPADQCLRTAQLPLSLSSSLTHCPLPAHRGDRRGGGGGGGRGRGGAAEGWRSPSRPPRLSGALNTAGPSVAAAVEVQQRAARATCHWRRAARRLWGCRQSAARLTRQPCALELRPAAALPPLPALLSQTVLGSLVSFTRHGCAPGLKGIPRLTSPHRFICIPFHGARAHLATFQDALQAGQAGVSTGQRALAWQQCSDARGEQDVRTPGLLVMIHHALEIAVVVPSLHQHTAQRPAPPVHPEEGAQAPAILSCHHLADATARPRLLALCRAMKRSPTYVLH